MVIQPMASRAEADIDLIPSMPLIWSSMILTMRVSITSAEAPG